MALTKEERRLRIKRRIRKIVSGTAERTRMSVYRSNAQISVQLIDDKEGKTYYLFQLCARKLLRRKATRPNRLLS